MPDDIDALYRHAGRAPGAIRLAGSLLPRFLIHVTGRPFRVGAEDNPPAGLRASAACRARRAVYDVMIDRLLAAYAALTGCSLDPESGRLVILLFRVLFAFDDEFERRLTGGLDLGFEHVMTATTVQGRLADWKRFTTGHHCAPALRDFLLGLVAEGYQEYSALAAAPGLRRNPAALLRTIELDSAGQLRCFVGAVGIFNGLPLAPEFRDQYDGLGIVGKLADDLIDFALDVGRDEPNLLFALLSERPAERERALTAVSSGTPRRLDLTWWRATCPETTAQFLNILNSYYAHVRDPRLRKICALLLLPAFWGRAPRFERSARATGM